ncbi:MAG: hypothetical protein BZY69_01690 [SAR202 cluster bacterium Casp-Chloro-G1]|nr:MAG: hypothetical protein BZY69_01690 [SAR202 cluster bacterium Casp-Chloro-G1]
MERDPDLQARVDSFRAPWLARRGLLALTAFVVLGGLIGALPDFLIWPVVLVGGAALSESEIRVGRAAKTVRDFDLRVTAFRVFFLSLVGIGAPLVAGPTWIIPVGLAVLLSASAAQLQRQAVVVMLASAISSYLVGSLLLASGVVTPLDPSGLSGAISLAGSFVIALALFPICAGFVFVRARRAAQSRADLERSVGELRQAQSRLSASEAEAQRISGRLAAEVERKTEELARRNRALSIVNAISFALNEPFEDLTAIRRAARLVARLLGVDSVQIRELLPADQGGTDILVGPVPDVDDLPGLPAAVIDAAIDAHEGVTRSEDGEDAAIDTPAYVIVPMVTQGTVRGSLTLVGASCRDWGEQELHLLTLIVREMGAALESARLYRDALALADRELLVTEVSALLGTDAPLHQQLDELLAKIGASLGPVFASVVSVEGGATGPELARWQQDGRPTLTDAELTALTALIPQGGKSSSATPHLAPADQTGDPVLRARFGDIVVAPILAASLSAVPAPVGSDADAPSDTGDTLPEASDRTNRSRAAVLVLAAPADAGWAPLDIEVLVRVANVVGRRLEGEQLVQLQQRRFDELAALAEIGRVIQSGADTDRLYSDFASALYRLFPYQQAYIIRVRDDTLSEVIEFSSGGRSRNTIAVDGADAAHGWFNARSATTWTRAVGGVPSFIAADAQAGLTLPMRPKGQLLGAVILVADEAQLLSARLAERAVEQLSLALDSAELYRQATERASRIEAQRNLASIVASAVDLRGAFDAFAEEIRWLIPFERAVMLTIDEAGEIAEQVAIYPPAPHAELISAPLAGSVLARALSHGGAVALPRSDESLARLDWSLVGDDAAEVAAVPIVHGRQPTAIFALVNYGFADYEQFDLRALEEVAGLLAVTIDRLRLYERAEHAARHDMLTGLPNYRFLQERLKTLRTELDEGQHSAVLVVDMDGLKLYNDTLGHEAGDRAIQRVAEELRRAVRGEDLVARTGGDEFVVVMEDVTEEGALIVAQRMHDSLRDIHHEFGNAPVPVRISIGLALAPDDGTGASELLEAADRAMYAAKFGGGDRTRAASGDRVSANAPRTLRRRGNRVMELLIRTAVDGASGSERLAVALAQRYVVAVGLGRGLPIDTADPLRMLVAAEAAHHIAMPEEYRDQETALMLLDGLRTQWDEQMTAADLQLDDLLAAAVRLAWEQIPAPEGPGLTAEQALAIVTNDPAYNLSPEVLDLLSQSAQTAEFERRRSRRDAA